MKKRKLKREIKALRRRVEDLEQRVEALPQYVYEPAYIPPSGTGYFPKPSWWTESPTISVPTITMVGEGPLTYEANGTADPDHKFWVVG